MKTKSYFKLIVLAVTAVAAMCPQWVHAQFSGSGSGTENDPYLIFNPIQLNEVRNYLDNSNVWFKMMYDIDLEEWLADNNPTQGWQPIGNSTSKFKGHFLGMGHKISGLYINRPSTNYIGLFGYTDGAFISDLIVQGESLQGYSGVGALAGYANNTNFTNCRVTMDIIGRDRLIGGLFGGVDNSSFTSCSFNGNVSGVSRVGGLVGGASSITITDCVVSASVTATGDSISLSLGYARGATIVRLKGNGQVTGSKYVGGVIGYCLRGSSGNATLSSVSNSSIDALVNGGDCVAGFVGYTQTSLSISSCNFVGNVIASGDYVGGLVGYSYSAYRYSSSITYTYNLNITDSYVIADVTGLANTGGLVGNKEIYNYNNNYYNYGSITNNYYNGTVTGTSNVGGLFGHAHHNNIEKNYCYGHVTGTSNVGGLIGHYEGCSSNYGSIKSNVSIMETVNATQSNVGRIYGLATNVDVGACGTSLENKGLATTKVTLNGLQQDLPDNLQHGTNVGNATLKLRATYQGIGWDFSNWKILETEGYPYKENQCAPPVINVLVSGATVVSGKSANGGTVYLAIGDRQYSAETNANVWTVTVDPLQPGDVVKAYAISDELEHSYITKQTVGFKGKGTKAEPYEIYTASDLSRINSRSYYKLMNDIDLTEWINQNSPVKGWIPVGLAGGGSMRQLDGDGHRVTGLWSNSTDEFYGLIANTQEATICNLSVFTAEGKSVKGSSAPGD